MRSLLGIAALNFVVHGQERQGKPETTPPSTTMPCHPRLPAELLDYIVDFLDTAIALRHCCLVSKSWIPRARRHLFAIVEFYSPEHLRPWTTTFTDPSTSPACYTTFLTLSCPTVADGKRTDGLQPFPTPYRFDLLCGHFRDSTLVFVSMRSTKCTLVRRSTRSDFPGHRPLGSPKPSRCYLWVQLS